MKIERLADCVGPGRVHVFSSSNVLAPLLTPEVSDFFMASRWTQQKPGPPAAENHGTPAPAVFLPKKASVGIYANVLVENYL